MLKGLAAQEDVEPYFPAPLGVQRGSHRLGGQCLPGKARMLCRLSKSIIRRDVELDACEWGSVRWMATGPQEGFTTWGHWLLFAEGRRLNPSFAKQTVPSPALQT